MVAIKDKEKAKEKALKQQSIFNKGHDDAISSGSDSEEIKDDLITDLKTGPQDDNAVK